MSISKQFENLRITKPVINIVFVGHVDAGKSTLCGQILVSLGLVDTRTLEKYKQQASEQNRDSWYLSWFLDINPEERERGKTTEVGLASFELPNRRVNIFDAPGHKQYVFEMIYGANQAEIGVLVVSARINEFEAGFEKGGQTREHLLLLKAGSVQKLVVLVNKMDDNSVRWCQQRFNEIKDKISKFVKKLFGIPVFIPVSGLKGDYIKQSGSCVWYTGPTFLDYLNSESVERNMSVLAVTITEKVRTMGSLVIHGKIESGILRKNSIIRILPGNCVTSIAQILSDDDVEIDVCQAGDCVKMRLKDDLDEIKVGYKFVEVDKSPYTLCTEFTCGLSVLDVDSVISPGFNCVLHINMDTVLCKIKELRDIDNKKLNFVRPGRRVLAKIVCENDIVLGNEESMKQSFALRFESKTVAVGIVRHIKK